MSYKRLIPSIIIDGGMAVKWFDDKTVVSNNVVSLAKHYSKLGADELLIFDLSETDEEHQEALRLIKKLYGVIRIPMTVGGNIKTIEDVKAILYTGAKRVMLNLSNKNSLALMEEAFEVFGKNKLAASVNDFDVLFKNQHPINKNCSEIIFMHRMDLDSVRNVTDVPAVILTDTMEEKDLFECLKSPRITGLSGKYISQTSIQYQEFKEKCEAQNIKMTTFESIMDFSEFKLNSDGLIPVIVQHYRTEEVLMLAYMDEEAFQTTVKTGKMTYYSRSRKAQWVKGETSGHFQYVKSLTIDCDKDTLLAKVDQIGAACHTGNPTCFYQPLVGTGCEELNNFKICETVLQNIKASQEEEAKSIDWILKSMGDSSFNLFLASKNANTEDMKKELTELLYQSICLMVKKGITWVDIIKELALKQNT